MRIRSWRVGDAQPNKAANIVRRFRSAGANPLSRTERVRVFRTMASLHGACYSQPVSRLMNRRQALTLMALSGALAATRQASVRGQSPAELAGITVAKFFTGVEVQAETDAQRRQVLSVLTDMDRQPIQVLRDRRYVDDAGIAGRWSLLDAVKHHFVPSENVRLTEEVLFLGLQQDAARSAVRRVLNDYQAMYRPQ